MEKGASFRPLPEEEKRAELTELLDGCISTATVVVQFCAGLDLFDGRVEFVPAAFLEVQPDDVRALRVRAYQSAGWKAKRGTTYSQVACAVGIYTQGLVVVCAEPGLDEVAVDKVAERDREGHEGYLVGR